MINKLVVRKPLIASHAELPINNNLEYQGLKVNLIGKPVCLL